MRSARGATEPSAAEPAERRAPDPLTGARGVLRQALWRVRYLACRMAGWLQFPFMGAQAPLRGHVVDTRAYARRSGLEFTELDPPRPQGSRTAPATFVTIVPQGRLLFDYGAVVTPDHRLLGEVSPPLGGPVWMHRALYERGLPRPERVAGTLAVLSSQAHQRYFHWMTDVLPRIELLRRADVAVDHYAVNLQAPFQRETLAWLGLPPDRLIDLSREGQIVADRLAAPSLPGEIGAPTWETCRFLRETFLRGAADRRPELRLYVRRRDALTRRVVNEEEVLAALVPLGFEAVDLERLSVAAQVDLFARAAVVVGPHGAGMTNLVFCPPGAGLVEFMPRTYFNPCFEILAGHVGARYRRLPAESVSAKTHDQWMDPAVLERALAELLR